MLSFFTGCAVQKETERWNRVIDTHLPVITVESPAPEPGQDILTQSGPLKLSVEQAVMSALSNNRDLHIQILAPVKAGTFDLIERAAFDPELFATIAFDAEDSIDTSDTGRETSVTDKTIESTMGIRKTFFMGTTMEATISHERLDEEGDPTTRETRVGLTLTQALLNGFGNSVNLVGVRQAYLDLAVSMEELRGVTQALVADTEILYWHFVLARRKIAIFEESLGVAKKQRDEIEQQIGVGLLPKMEAAAARSEVALREQDLIDAKSLAETQRLKLVRLINPGGEPGFDRALIPTGDPVIDTTQVTDPADRINLAHARRPDLREARLRLEKNRLETVQTRNGLLPRLDLFITLGRTGYAHSFMDSFQDIGDDDLTDIRVGLSLTHMVGNRENRAIHESAFASRRQAELAVANLCDIIDLDVRLAINEVNRTARQITATHTTRLFQEETWQAEKNRFDVGSSTALMVAQAQRDLLTAKIAEVEAIVTYRISLVNLHLAQGTLLEMRGIKMTNA